MNGRESVNSGGLLWPRPPVPLCLCLSVCLSFCFTLTLLLTLSWSGLLKWGVHAVRALMGLLQSDCFCQWHAQRHTHTHTIKLKTKMNHLEITPFSISSFAVFICVDWLKEHFRASKKKKKSITLFIFINACTQLWFHTQLSEKCELFVTKNKVVEVNPQVKPKEILFYECKKWRNIFLVNLYSTFFLFCFGFLAFLFHC